MLISQNQASIKAGCSRQNISLISRKEPRPEFFVDVKGQRTPLVDTDHPEWKSYIQERIDRYEAIGQIKENAPKVIYKEVIKEVGYTEAQVGELLRGLAEKIAEVCKPADAKKLQVALGELVGEWEKGE
jgi:hypothetical protein